MKRYYAKPGDVLCLGRQGENEARQIVFDLGPWERLYGSGTVQLLAQRSGGKTPYPVALETEESFAAWTIRTADTEIAGRCGQCELQYYAGDVLAKSAIWKTVVYDALEGPVGPVPEPQETWVSQILQAGVNSQEAAEKAQQAQQNAEQALQETEEAKEAAGQSAEDAANSAKASINAANQAESAAIRQPYPDPETGTWWTWNAETGAYVDTGVAAQGKDGITPHIGDNGNWYIGDVDTGVVAQGPQGEPGPPLAIANTASVGQTIRVSAVDDNGQPTEWEAVDAEKFPEITDADEGKALVISPNQTAIWGYPSATLPLVASIELTDETAIIEISQDNNGNPLALEEMDIYFALYGGANNPGRDSAVMYFNGISTAVGRINLGTVIGATGAWLLSSQYFIKRERGHRWIGQTGYNSAETAINEMRYVDVFDQNNSNRYPKFTQINLYPSTSGNTFGVGTKIMIYGR